MEESIRVEGHLQLEGGKSCRMEGALQSQRQRTPREKMLVIGFHILKTKPSTFVSKCFAIFFTIFMVPEKKSYVYCLYFVL